MAAIATATSRVRIGALVTPTPRRRIHKLARETVTLDRLSEGRLVLGVGVGGDGHGEFGPFGEETDMRARARQLDADLERLMALWGGEFQPVPVQQPRIPVWVAARWPNRRPVRRALRWDGIFPIDLPGPEALAELVAEVRAERDDGCEGGVDEPVGSDFGPWEAAGATWCLTGFGKDPREAAVREAIAAGPWRRSGPSATSRCGRTRWWRSCRRPGSSACSTCAIARSRGGRGCRRPSSG